MTEVDLSIHEEERTFFKFTFKKKKKDIQTQMPTLRPSMCPMGLHQDPKASHCSVEISGKAFACLHRRHPHLDRVQGTGMGPCHRPVIPTEDPRLCDKQVQVCSGTYTVNRVSRVLSELSSARTEPSSRKVKKIRAETWHLLEATMITARKLSKLLGRLQVATRAVPLAPKTVATGTAEGTRPVRSTLLSPASPLHGGAEVVVGPSVWLDHLSAWNSKTFMIEKPSLVLYRVGCLNSSLGSILRRGMNSSGLQRRGSGISTAWKL